MSASTDGSLPRDKSSQSRDETSQLRDGSSLPRLVSVMQRLLAPDGCPWDREQTLATLRAFVIEEAFEVVDAIDSGEPEALREELGDLLLQVVFQAELARAKGWFGPDDVVSAIVDKLVRRHPHVFGDEKADTSAEVLVNWEKLKAKEKKGRGALDGVPTAMPSLLRALRTGEKVARLGLDWPDSAGPRAKVDEELAELDEAIKLDDREGVASEIGDVLFAVANLARKQGVDPESALRDTLNRFTRRVKHVETQALEQNVDLSSLSAEEMDRRWEAAKAALSEAKSASSKP